MLRRYDNSNEPNWGIAISWATYPLSYNSRLLESWQTNEIVLRRAMLLFQALYSKFFTYFLQNILEICIHWLNLVIKPTLNAYGKRLLQALPLSQQFYLVC